MNDLLGADAPRPKVERLDPLVVAKIAAGEMILQPLSVAKELVENALDARSRRIEVELGERPDALLVVHDDGIGMTTEDLRLALEPHATSKLRTEEDLLRVGSLGFRGEAVPSIGRVARMEIRTAPDGDGLGQRAVVEGGELRAFEPVARSQGTTVRVEDLFFNSPVRKRFLRSGGVEARAIRRMIETYALAHPAVHFLLRSRGETEVDLAPATGLADRIVQLHGPKMLDKLLPLEDRGPSHGLFGFVGVPELARAGSQHQTFLVNGRWVAAPWLTTALRQAYGDLLPPSRNPWAILLLWLDPARVDVNVHPTKREVRFLDESELFGWLLRVVRAQTSTLVPTWSLEQGDAGGGWSRAGGASESGRGVHGGTPGVRPSGAGRIADPRGGGLTGYRPELGPLLDALYRGPGEGAAEPGSSGTTIRPGSGVWGAAGDPGDAASDADSPGAFPGAASTFHPFGSAAGEADAAAPVVDAAAPEADQAGFSTRPFWQLHRRYVVVETGGGFLVIDQHAAHERILYERFLAQLESGAGPTQQLLAPIPVSLDGEEAELCARFAGDFPALGLDVEEFGGDTVLLRGVPALWADDPEQHFRDVLADLSDRPSRRLRERVEHLAASFACRSAIKSGRALSPGEMARLVRDLFATSLPHGDPHGRPTYIEVNLGDLDRRFGRH